MTSVGITHPIVTFQLNLNVDLIQYLHPSRHQTNQDNAQLEAKQFQKLLTSWLPGLLRGENFEHNTNGTVTFKAYGQQAKYYIDTYTKGTTPLLTVVTNTYSSHA